MTSRAQNCHCNPPFCVHQRIKLCICSQCPCCACGRHERILYNIFWWLSLSRLILTCKFTAHFANMKEATMYVVNDFPISHKICKASIQEQSTAFEVVRMNVESRRGLHIPWIEHVGMPHLPMPQWFISYGLRERERSKHPHTIITSSGDKMSSKDTPASDSFSDRHHTVNLSPSLILVVWHPWNPGGFIPCIQVRPKVGESIHEYEMCLHLGDADKKAQVVRSQCHICLLWIVWERYIRPWAAHSTNFSSVPGSASSEWPYMICM